MKSKLILAVTLLAATGGACDNDDPVDPGAQTSINGIELGASVTNIAGGGELDPGMILALSVTLRNTTSAPIVVNYPAGCPVRVRLYLPGNDDLLYDQTVFPCDVTTTIPLTVGAGQTRTLSSGTAFPWAVQADSVPAGFYRATAVLRIAGQNPIELEAGQYRLPNCPDPSRPATCAFVGPGATVDPARRR
jgi:hypothetical protein